MVKTDDSGAAGFQLCTTGQVTEPFCACFSICNIRIRAAPTLQGHSTSGMRSCRHLAPVYLPDLCPCPSPPRSIPPNCIASLLWVKGTKPVPTQGLRTCSSLLATLPDIHCLFTSGLSLEVTPSESPPPLDCQLLKDPHWLLCPQHLACLLSECKP